MASATIQETINGETANLLVVYPHTAGANNATFIQELLLIKAWFIAFNYNRADSRGTLPDSTQSYPAAVLLVTCGFHVSTFAKREPPHITGHVSTPEAWASDPRNNNSCVHIYAINNMLAHGYRSWLLKNRKERPVKTAEFQAKVAAALANYRGILGQGDLA